MEQVLKSYSSASSKALQKLPVESFALPSPLKYFLFLCPLSAGARLLDRDLSIALHADSSRSAVCLHTGSCSLKKWDLCYALSWEAAGVLQQDLQGWLQAEWIFRYRLMPGKAEGVQRGSTSFACKGTLQIPQDLLSCICSVTAVLPWHIRSTKCLCK